MSKTPHKTLCFRQTRNMHSSGFRYVEYGYIDVDDKVEVVGRYDLIHTPYDSGLLFRIDLTKSGWFRILPFRKQRLEWGYGGEILIEREARANERQAMLDALPEKFYIAPNLDSDAVMVTYYKNEGRNETIGQIRTAIKRIGGSDE